MIYTEGVISAARALKMSALWQKGINKTAERGEKRGEIMRETRKRKGREKDLVMES